MTGASESQGVVYTPEYWADWAVREFDIHRKWMQGASILDPGCGRGALLGAVVRIAISDGYTPTTEDLSRLTGVDIDKEALRTFADELELISGIGLPEGTLRQEDFLLKDCKIKADIIFANPPWLTFGDLDEVRKEKYKPIFRNSGLTPDAKNLLLGGSRIDLAALFTITALGRNLAEGGQAFLFLPMSLFRSEGAHEAFRRLPLADGRSCALTEIRELNGGAPFPGAGTRHGFARYHQGRRQTWPVKWLRAESKGGWYPLEAYPIGEAGSPFVPLEPGEKLSQIPRIHVPEGARPRQGANPCGAAESFIIEETGEVSAGLVSAVNRKGMEGILPTELLYPLMTPGDFAELGNGDKENNPRRWIFLPYRKDGKVMNRQELEVFPEALEWLERHRNKLESRKGSLIAGWRNRGIWWAMMGVGPYAFAPWKLAWESYGKARFRPRLFGKSTEGLWQGNQALHAYIPFDNAEEALQVLERFRQPEVETYLENLGGAGTRFWAQPGRISRLLYQETQKR